MFKLAVFAAILAVAFAAPGGFTGVHVSHGLGPIVAPAVVSHAPVLAHGAVIAAHQPIAPAIHAPAVVTKTVLTGHGGIGLGHGIALGHGGYGGYALGGYHG